ncbi:MAG TPA: shikimate kinase [Longimicrobiales bacterium]|nr:shikimate kinase [Longimicrobiales bacterium]
MSPHDVDRMPERVLLIGFMAAGKTTVGKRLAALLGWTFLDFDEEIERRIGVPVAEIFRRYGEPYFRELEAALTLEVHRLKGMVLAPGGGWITQPGLLDIVRDGTYVVWLRISPEEALKRARRTISRRPLLAGPDPLGRARALIAQREPLYQAAADLVIDVNGRRSTGVAREIYRRMQEWTGGSHAPPGTASDGDGRFERDG